MTISVPGGATGFSFWAKQNSGNPNQIKVELVIKALADYTAANSCKSDAYVYHMWKSPVLTSGWVQYSATFAQYTFPSYFSASTINGINYKQSGTASLNDPGARGANGDLYLMAIQMSPWNPQTYPSTPANSAFDFSLDQLEFY